MPDPPGTTIVQGLPDRVGAVSFARVTRARHAMLRRVRERPRMVARRVAPLGSGEIESDHARGAVLGRRARQLERLGRRPGADPAHDHSDLGAGLRLAALDAGERRLDRLRQRERGPVQQRRIPHLHVAHAVGRRVEHEFVGDTLQRRGRLHH